MYQFEDYPDRDMLAMNVADRLASELKSALMTHETASFAVPGGTTPAPMFDFLSGLRLDWERVHVMLTDERWVPEDHERSNTGMLRKHLFTGPAEPAHFVPFYGDGAPEDVVPQRAAALASELPISVLVLGMGADMHTASLFPGAPGLEAALAPDAPALNILRPEGEPDVRISLAAHVLNGALSKHLIIIGKKKREALERAMHLSPQEAPIRAVMTDLTVHWCES